MKKKIYRIDEMPSKKELKKIYNNMLHSQQKIAKKFNVSITSLRSWLNNYKIKSIPRKIPTKKVLERLYVNKRKPLHFIGKIYKASRWLVAKWLRHYGIRVRGKEELNIIKMPSKDILYDLYVTKNKTIGQIHKIYSCSRSLVIKWLKIYNIKVLNRQESAKYKSKIIKKLRIKGCLDKYGVKYNIHDKNIRKKMVSNGYKFKNYILPSGRTVKIQGYENYALDFLLKEYKEKDIKIHRGCPTIFYSYHREHREYRPDIFIPKENLIIEVKSDWTFKLDKNKNLKKKRAVVEKGYNFMFMIFEDQGKNIKRRFKPI
jgi:transposase